MLKKILLPVFLAASLSTVAIAQDITCKVTAVSDGDTFKCLAGGKTLKVRMAQIDAPEKDQAYGQESKAALTEAIQNKDVQLMYSKNDQYGRVIGTVAINGVDINLQQIEKGLAWYYTQYANDPIYKDAEEKAQAAKIGLWADSDAQAPWEYRREKKAKGAASKPVAAKAETSEESSDDNCGSKTKCTQMTSCKEAKHYLNVCGVSRLDRDGDGVPCESLCK